jgi:hypothetical protein
MSDAATYPRPRHGWTCFHCGETFGAIAAARLHFGADPLADAACRIKAEEYGLLVALRRLEKDFAALIDRMHELDGQIYVANGEVQAVLQAAKAASAHQVRCNIDSLEGRAIAAEAIVRQIEAIDPGAVERARDAVCRAPS